MKRTLLFVLLLFWSGNAFAAGSVVVTSTKMSTSIVRHSVVWTSDASGDVSGNAVAIAQGRIFQIEFVPGSGGSQPSDLYDLTLSTSSGSDVLIGAGANLSQTTGKILLFSPLFYYDGSAALTFVVAAAGNAKSGTMRVWVEQ